MMFTSTFGLIVGMVMIFLFLKSGCPDSWIYISAVAMVVLMILGGVGQTMMNREYKQALAGSMHAVKQHVEGRLNDQWQSSRGIKWSMESEQTIHSQRTEDGTRVTTVTWYHIGITCVQSAQEAMNQAAH